MNSISQKPVEVFYPIWLSVYVGL